jgi:hypothetical protein
MRWEINRYVVKIGFSDALQNRDITTTKGKYRNAQHGCRRPEELVVAGSSMFIKPRLTSFHSTHGSFESS